MFVSNLNNNDCGDFWSMPKHYFNDLNKHSIVSVDSLDNHINEKIAILGGGASLNINLIKKLYSKIDINKTTLICWGAGFNNFDLLTSGTFIENIQEAKKVEKNPLFNFELKGIRDYGLTFDYDWVPCTSCMHPLFLKYKKNNASRKIGIYFHYDRKFIIKNVEDDDYLSNKGFDMEDKLSFLSKYEYIITNSYHGAYWSQLLGKKVICLPVKSSLFNFCHKPVFLTKEKFKLQSKNKNNDPYIIKIKEEVFDHCVVHSEALNESIDANIKFYKKVKQVI